MIFVSDRSRHFVWSRAASLPLPGMFCVARVVREVRISSNDSWLPPTFFSRGTDMERVIAVVNDEMPEDSDSCICRVGQVASGPRVSSTWANAQSDRLNFEPQCLCAQHGSTNSEPQQDQLGSVCLRENAERGKAIGVTCQVRKGHAPIQCKSPDSRSIGGCLHTENGAWVMYSIVARSPPGVSSTS